MPTFPRQPDWRHWRNLPSTGLALAEARSPTPVRLDKVDNVMPRTQKDPRERSKISLRGAPRRNCETQTVHSSHSTVYDIPHNPRRTLVYTHTHINDESAECGVLRAARPPQRTWLIQGVGVARRGAVREVAQRARAGRDDIGFRNLVRL